MNAAQRRRARRQLATFTGRRFVIKGGYFGGEPATVGELCGCRAWVYWGDFLDAGSEYSGGAMPKPAAWIARQLRAAR